MKCISFVTFLYMNHVDSFITVPFINKVMKPVVGLYNTDNTYSMSRKTILDLDDSFINSTHYTDLDLTVAIKNSSTNKNDIGNVIFLPGLDMSGLSLYSNAIRASEERNVIVFLAGYSRNQTLQDLTDRVVNYISHNEFKDITLIGESFGGVLAIKCIPRIKKRVKKLILLNPATSFPRTKWMKTIKSKTNKHTSVILGHGPRVENIIKSIGEMMNEFPEYTYSYIITYIYMVFNILVTEPELITTRIINYLGISHIQVDSMCRAVSVPTLIVIGKEDKLLPSYKESDKLSQMIQGSIVIKLNNTGHMVTSDVFDIRDFM